MIESVSELRKNLSTLDWDLLVFNEKPEQAIFDLIKARFDLSRDNGPKIAKTFILFQEDICSEEKKIEEALTTKMVELQTLIVDSDIEVIQYWGNTLWHVDDLYNMDATLYTDWMKNNEGVEVRPLVEIPQNLPKGSSYREGSEYLPTVEEFGLKEIEI